MVWVLGFPHSALQGAYVDLAATAGATLPVISAQAAKVVQEAQVWVASELLTKAALG